MKSGIETLLRGCGLLAIFACTAFVAQAQRGLTPHDVVSQREVEELAISPDGALVAYALEVPRRPGVDEDGEAWLELHVVDREGVSRPYVTGQVEVSEISWARDGQWITYLAHREGEDDALFAIPTSGGEARRIAVLETEIDAYSLCSDGRRLALIGAEPEPLERKALEEKGFNAEVYEEDALPNRLWLSEIGEDGTAKVGDFLDLQGSVEAASWNPTCDRLAVSVAPSSLVDDELIRTRLRIVDPRSGRVIERIANPGKLGDVAWHKDARRLAFLSAEDENDPREGRLMVASSSGGAFKDLIPGLEGHVVDFAWHEDSLIYISQEGVEARLGVVHRKGGAVKSRLLPGGPIFTDLSVAPTGEVALRGSTPEHPNEVFFLKAAGTKARRLTFSNPWLDEVRLARQEIVRYTARDGLALEGLLIRPLDEEPGKKYPLILVVHGGPESHYSNGWLTTYSAPGQTGAARGFMVFYPNYRASTGRGVEFSKLDHGDAAGKEFDDLVDGVDHLVDQGLVDRDRVAITGGSYGGYATAWGATYYSERFAAAVMMVGISEKIAKFGTSDIPNELYQVHERKWPWEDFQYALERSPVYYVEKARTPILIAHGEKDTRVFPGQSRILYRFLKTIGKAPVRLVLYPEEPHGNRRAAGRLDFSLRQLRWIEHYLIGPGGSPPPMEVDYQLPELHPTSP